MSKLPGCVAATAIGAAIVTATPGFGAGVDCVCRRFVGRVHGPAFVRHHHHFRNFVSIGEPFLFDYGGYGNYCWQQVWTAYGWQWFDACAGYYGFGF